MCNIVDKIKIDPELKDLLPPLTMGELNNLSNSIREHGFLSTLGRIVVWSPPDDPQSYYIVDGHNRYETCTKSRIPLTEDDFMILPCKTKDEVKIFMLKSIQQARRNTTPIQRIMIAETMRPYVEAQAKEYQRTLSRDPHRPHLSKLTEAEKTEVIHMNTRDELSRLAGTGSTTYGMAVKVLNSGNEELRSQLINGELTINGAYTKLKELTEPKQSKKKKSKPKPDAFKSMEKAIDACTSAMEQTKPEQLDDCINKLESVAEKLVTLINIMKEKKENE